MKAKAVLTFRQVGTLLEGKPVTIRLPEQNESPAIDLELSREPIPRSTRVVYKVTSGTHPEANVDLDMSFIDKVFEDFDALFETLEKGFQRIFRLPRSK